MRLLIPFLGKTKESYLDAGIRDYATRLGRFAPVDLPVLRERHKRKEPDDTIKLIEAGQLLEQAQAVQVRVVLDPNGDELDSAQLAGLLTKWEAQGVSSVCFFIGGFLGLHQSVLDQANHTLSLSRLTFTHEMTRLILLEQLYRAWTIKAGHKYHK
ncbi:MAG: 23S rRNA (pseudouridine(1915)-N(3))-methyltransferase RlmH [Desulfobulbus sp.]|nr:23S rRNA (pseudouridine(1915)-N(3))-methyltransferase RlmH [Desulfobulbus sp.]